MNKYIKKCSFVLLMFCSVNLSAQSSGRDFKAIDDYVKSLGNLDSMSMGTINNVVSNKFEDKMDRARAIYDWIAMNITYDIKAGRTNNTSKNSVKEVLQTRRAVGAGFAALFQDMCSSAGIRCLTVNGFVKNTIEQIGEKSTDINHTWAVVQLGQSPDTWYYVDPAWGSGYADAEMKTFTKSFTTAYFFADKATFNLQHYPDNEAWKLGSGPRNKRDFYGLPLVKVAALEFDMKKFSPNDGILKAKAGKPVYFSYALGNKEQVTKVSLAIGEKKKYVLKDIDYVFNGGALSFSYKFDDGNFPVTVIINGRELVTYSVEAD
jgi:transglutaminase/protease-like cytokinesis protein 3